MIPTSRPGGLRVLVCGDFRSIPLTSRCADALGQLGCAVARFDSEERIGRLRGIGMRLAKSAAKLVGLKQRLSDRFRREIYDQRRRAFLGEVDATDPQLIFLVRGNTFDHGTLASLRERARLACWFIKHQDRVAAMRSELSMFDLYYSMHRSHEAEGASFLPVFAFEPDDYFPDDTVSKDVPLLFVGQWTPKRQRYLEAVAEEGLTLFGPGWDSRLPRSSSLRQGLRGRWVSGSELRRWYQRSQVVININQWDTSDLSGANLRVADVPACGTVLLTEHTPDLDEVFRAGDDLAVFRSAEEMRLSAQHLLRNPERRRELEAAGLAAVQRLGSYRDRMSRLLADYHRLDGGGSTHAEAGR